MSAETCSNPGAQGGALTAKGAAGPELIRKNLASVKHKLIVMSGKGGVGKSTVAVNLAVSLVRRGCTVGLLDADIHGPSVPKLLGVPNLPLNTNQAGRIVPMHVPPGLKVISMAFLLGNRDAPVIWRGPVKMGALKQFLEDVEWGELDYLIVDLPPGTGDEPLSIAQLIPSPDGTVIVTTPQDVALLSVRKSINFARAVNLPVIGIIENMSGLTCPHCGKEINVFGDGGPKEAAKEMSIPYLGRLPLTPAIAKHGDAGKPFVSVPNLGVVDVFEQITEKIVSSVERKR
ncbi:MAG: Mrp/NBP35 family ATP-binding protein [Thermoplasmata archaeon]|jgi:Mrp family chromosome partitioning ATPase|nr:Mrp/NBP35 family ATP-binding protein [Thermoplasmata archaeon]